MKVAIKTLTVTVFAISYVNKS